MRFSTRQVATLALLGWALSAGAATTNTAVTGTKGVTDQSCLQFLTIAVSDGENCMYNGGPAQIANQPFGETTGPLSMISYYDSLAMPGAFNPAFVPTPGDGKIEQVISGTV